MKLSFVALIAFGLLGCAHHDLPSQPPFRPSIGIPEFQEWCAKALRQPNAALAFRRFNLAYHGDTVAVRSYFTEAVKQCESPEVDVAGDEFLTWTLDTLLQRLGDQKFAAILANESPRNQSAVADFLSKFTPASFPQVEKLLDAAPKIDFPMDQTERGDYHPSTPRP